MKKVILLTVAICWVSVVSLQAGVKIGVKAGVNLAKAEFNTSAIQTDNFTGFQVGPMIELSALGLGFDAAILYSQHGIKVKGTEEVEGLNEKVSSLDVPINLKMKFSLAGLAGLYLTAGPYASFKVATPAKLKEQWDAKDFGTGLNFGAGVELLSKLQVGINYRLPLTNDFNTISVGDATDFSVKTRIWSITAAYFF
jgi:long-subunit fatty acid transport protein